MVAYPLIDITKEAFDANNAASFALIVFVILAIKHEEFSLKQHSLRAKFRN